MTENPLWNFSLEFYGRPEVARACLDLQDEAGADVNILLYLLWCAATGRPLDRARIQEADALVATWRQTVIEPLRKIRRGMKNESLPGDAAETCRERVKAAELEAEAVSQAALRSIAPATGEATDVAGAAASYVALYEALLGRRFPQGPVSVLCDAIAA
ncbi:MAG: TIGR02444 family protein [Beijerinckiaceae bacterium]